MRMEHRNRSRSAGMSQHYSYKGCFKKKEKKTTNKYWRTVYSRHMYLYLTKPFSPFLSNNHTYSGFAYSHTHSLDLTFFLNLVVEVDSLPFVFLSIFYNTAFQLFFRYPLPCPPPQAAPPPSSFGTPCLSPLKLRSLAFPL